MLNCTALHHEELHCAAFYQPMGCSAVPAVARYCTMAWCLEDRWRTRGPQWRTGGLEGGAELEPPGEAGMLHVEVALRQPPDREPGLPLQPDRLHDRAALQHLEAVARPGGRRPAPLRLFVCQGEGGSRGGGGGKGSLALYLLRLLLGRLCLCRHLYCHRLRGRGRGRGQGGQLETWCRQCQH
jgi:hypothetical protein